MIGINRKDIRAVLFYFRKIAEAFLNFQEFVVKMWSNQETSVRKQVENLCEAVRYAMHSSGKNSLAVGLLPYKIAKINAFASKLAGRYFHHFAWLVAFTKSSQNN